MIKKSLLLTLLLAILAPWAAQAQETVEIGDGTSTSRYVPIGTYYNYSITEQLYTADEIGTAGTISSISFNYAVSTAKDFPIAVYMMNTDAADLSTGISLADAELVFDGTLSVTGPGWATITLDTPFAYDGTSNLLIGINKGYVYYYNDYTWYCTGGSNVMTRYSQNDSNAYNAATASFSNSTNSRPNIQIEITPAGGATCAKPDNLIAYNEPTATSFYFSIDGGSGVYNIELKEGNGDWEPSASQYTDTVYGWNDLESNTAYQVRVQSVCDGGLTSGWKTMSFTTKCEVLTNFPITYGFETSEGFPTNASTPTSNQFGPCWRNEATVQTGSNSNRVWGTSTSSKHTGSQALILPDKGNSSNPAKTMLVFPEMNFTDANGYVVSFWIQRSGSSSNPEGFKVYASDCDTIGPNAVELGHYSRNYGIAYPVVEPTFGWYQYETEPITMTGSVHIIFEGHSYYGNATYVDDIEIKVAPSCFKPTGLAASNVTAHEATINWTSEATAWQIQLNDEDAIDVTEATYTFTGLDAETTYSVKVRTNCDGTYSEWTSPVSFTTTIACPAPTALTTSNLTGHGATITWTAEEGAWYQSALVKTAEYDANNITWSESFEGNSQTWNNLDPETGYTFALRKDCGSEDGYSTVVTRTFTTAVACPVPTVAVTNITATTADVTCTNTEATAFNLQLINPNATPADTTTFANVAMPYTLTGLTQITSYRVRVQALCGGDGESAWSNGTNFMTAEECPDGMVCIGTGTATSSYVPVTTCYNYSLSQQIYTADEIGEAGAVLSIDFYSTNGAAKSRNFDIYMVNTDKSRFESTTDWIAVTAADLVYSATNYTWQTGWNSFELDVPFVYDGTSNVAIVVDDEKVTSYECSVNFGVFDAPSQAIYVRQDGSNYDPFNTTYTATGVLNLKNRIRLAIGEPPACPKPTNLAVEYTGGTEAIVSWTSDAEAWNMRVNGVDVNGVITNPYTLTGLELATDYEVKVQANCGDNGTSEWAGPVSFTTDLCMPENQCEITFELTDSYGDGWNGAYIDVVDAITGVSLGHMSNNNIAKAVETETYTLAVCDGREIQFVWHTGSFDSECSFVIKDINEEEIVSGNSSVLPFNYTVNCTVIPCKKPTDLAVSEISGRSAVLSWTENGEATEWEVEITNSDNDSTIVWTAVTNPYTMLYLDPETNYSVRVLPHCVVEKWSDPITFTTLDVIVWNYPEDWPNDSVPEAYADVTVPANTQVIVPSGYTAYADEITIEEGGQIIIEEGGELIHSNEVPVVFQMNVEGYQDTRDENPDNDGYRLIASPVYESSNNPSIAIPEAMIEVEENYDLYMFDQTQELEWINHKVMDNNQHQFTTLDLGKGYLYANTANVFVAFVGQTTPTNLNVGLDMVYEPGHVFTGWNLLGNPYTATAYADRAYYVLDAEGDEVISAELGVGIAPMKGFFVEAGSAEDLTCTVSTTPQNNNTGSLNINLSQANTLADRAIVSFGSGMTLGKFQLNPKHTKVYISQEGKDYAVVSASDKGEMPVSFKAEKNGNYTLSFTNKEVTFSYLRLIDNMTGVETDLLETPSYTFNARTTDYANRFRLVFATSSNDGDSFAYFNNGNLVINNEGQATLQVVDVMGRILRSESINGCASISVKAAPGVYMLRLINGNDVKVQKVIIK